MNTLRGGPKHSALPPSRLKKRSKWQLELAVWVLAGVVLAAALNAFVVKSFYIPSESMEDTLLVEDRVIATKLAPAWLDLHRGDVVVFHDLEGWNTERLPLPEKKGFGAWMHGLAQGLGLAPASSDDFLIKRVIGLEGDRVACAGPGEPVTVNGQPLDETYLKAGAEPSTIPFSVTVPPEAIWVMGDNRANSLDSRFHLDQELGGAVPVDQVVGVAQLRMWPFSRFSVLRNPGDVFASVPDPG
jgi:signal peptidase I